MRTRLSFVRAFVSSVCTPILSVCIPFPSRTCPYFIRAHPTFQPYAPLLHPCEPPIVLCSLQPVQYNGSFHPAIQRGNDVAPTVDKVTSILPCQRSIWCWPLSERHELYLKDMSLIGWTIGRDRHVKRIDTQTNLFIGFEGISFRKKTLNLVCGLNFNNFQERKLHRLWISFCNISTLGSTF
jgi:hypothetical protein